MALLADVLPDVAYQLTLAADPLAVREGLARIAGSGPMTALSANHRATAEIVLAEVLNNITEHAYADRPGKISVSLWAAASGLDCEIVDHGREIPGGSPPKGTLPQEELPEGGFGWYLIRMLTTDLHYRRVRDRNRLRFVIPS